MNDERDLTRIIRSRFPIVTTGAKNHTRFGATPPVDDVAGLANLKRWLKQRRAAFVDDAAAMGLNPPKGVLLGMQGGGQGLTAKAVAGTWQLPLSCHGGRKSMPCTRGRRRVPRTPISGLL